MSVRCGFKISSSVSLSRLQSKSIGEVPSAKTKRICWCLLMEEQLNYGIFYWGSVYNMLRNMIIYSYYLILGSDEYNSLSDEERGSSRPQVWSKYPLDVQKEFGYDSPHDLDSD